MACMNHATLKKGSCMKKNTQMEPSVKKRAFMGLASKDLRKALDKNPNLSDSWVKKQLDNMGKGDLYFDGIAKAIKNRDVGTEASYKNIQKSGGPIETSWKGTMSQLTKSMKRRLEQYKDDPEIAANPDEYVKNQLEKHSKGDYAYPGVSKDILNGRVGTEISYARSEGHQKYLKEPGMAEVEERIAKRHGRPYRKTFSVLDTNQEELKDIAVSQAKQKAQEQFPKIGQQVPLEQPVNDLMMKLLQQYNQGTLGNEYLSGIDAVFPGLKQNLSGLGQGAQQAGQAVYGAGQNAINTINPYVQSGLQAAAPYAQSAMNKGQEFASQALPYLNPQPYLSAAQPYAKQAANLGGDILNSIRGPAINAGNQTMQGLGNLLSMLKGRM